MRWCAKKAIYPSADHWIRSNTARDIDLKFHSPGGALFAVEDFVPTLEKYVEKHQIGLNFFHTLVAVDSPGRKVWFDVSRPEIAVERIEVEFDMMHVTPPQGAPDFIAVCPLADAVDRVNVDPSKLRHKIFDNTCSLGGMMNAIITKTAAAARKQAPVVADNTVTDMQDGTPIVQYDGYEACPLTDARDKVILAEFSYGGTLQASFPRWLIDDPKPRHLA
ncbi:MAG: hypothetical protein R8G34_13440 [Paracoccaceae bacterium]|nr:hypothetical protein [Paracoccaceae bacterium]